MSLPHVAIEVRVLLEGLPAEFAGLAVQDQFFGELRQGGLLKLL